MDLTERQQERYARHLLLEGWGGEGQERLLASSVRVQGEGPAALWAVRYLAASGLGAVVAAPSVLAACTVENPDVRLLATGDALLEIAPEGTAADGALAALRAIAGLLAAPR